MKRAFTPDMPMDIFPNNESTSIARAYFKMWKNGELNSVEKYNENSRIATNIRDSWIGENIGGQVKNMPIGSKRTGAFGSFEALGHSIAHWDQTWANFQGAGNWSAFRDKSGIHVHYWNTISYNSYAIHSFGNIKNGGMSNVTLHMYWTVK